MSFLTSRMYSTLSPPRQRESMPSFRPLARDRWRFSTLFCCILCGKSWFSTIGQHHFVGRFSNSVGHFSNFVGDFSNFVGDFSVCLVSMCKMCATTTTIHVLSVQPFAHARELLSLCTLKSRLRSVKFSLRTFRPGRCKRR